MQDNLNSVLNGNADIKEDSLLRELTDDKDDILSVELDVPNVLEMCLAPQGEKGFSPHISLSREGNTTTISALNEDSVERSYVKDGVTFTPDVSEDGILTWTNNGELKNPKPSNIKGPKGEFTVSGTVKHESLLPDINTVENGTLYFVGIEIPRDLYIADRIQGQWINQGKLEGPKGEPGDFNFATFEIEDGYLIANKTENLTLVNFNLNEKGELEVIING